MALGAASGEASGSGGRIRLQGPTNGAGGHLNDMPLISLGSGPGLDHTSAMDGLELVNSLSSTAVPMSALETAMNTLARNRGNGTAGRAAQAESDIRDAKLEKDKGAMSEDEKKLAEIYESFDFESIWTKLSQVLTRLRGDPNAAQILLPLIEVSSFEAARRVDEADSIHIL